MKAEIIIERLCLFRQELGMTQQQAAALIGVSQPAYQRYESGTRIPSVQIAQQIASVFGTSVDYLTGKSDQKENDQIVINRKDSPVVFNIFERCKGLDDAQLKRLSAYLDCLIDKTP